MDDAIDEAQLSPDYLRAGIERFVGDRETRLERLKIELSQA
jgi:hypothetical protein